ncbi:MAG: cupin domain-containing protein [Chloroflexi bacterium]|nr:cupin domain-containing protein [Chloroflexota bacterium]
MPRTRLVQKEGSVQIKIVDLKAMAGQKARMRQVLMNTPKFHTWLNVYEPGQEDEMHCHNADQTFYLVAGECTMRFPDGTQAVMQPGQIALMPGGQFYQLANVTQEKVVLLGARTLSQEKSLKIDYETRKPIFYGDEKADRPEPTGTRILV